MFYPNPASNQLIISATDTILQNAEIYDFTGRLIKVFSFEENNRQTLDVSQLTPGTYLTYLKTIDNDIIVKRLIKK